MDNKICPLFVIGFYSFKSVDEEKDEADVSCFENCAWWDKENKHCAILTLAKVVKKAIPKP